MNKEQIRQFLEETSEPVLEKVVFDLINGYQNRIEKIENDNRIFINLIKTEIENIQNNIKCYNKNNNNYSIQSIQFSINLIQNIIKNIENNL